MTSFIQPNFPAQHLGVARMVSAAKALNGMGRDFGGTKGLSAMLRGKLLTADTQYQVYRIQLAQLQSNATDASGFAKPFADLVAGRRAVRTGPGRRRPGV